MPAFFILPILLTLSAAANSATNIVNEAEETENFKALVNAMRDADADKLPYRNYGLDWGNELQMAVASTNNKLFTFVDESVFTRPVYEKLIKLYQQNVFSPNVCVEEPPTTGFRKTMFLDVLDVWTNTTVFSMAHQYLVTKGKADADLDKFKDFLFTFWFGTYTRCNGTIGSSGFEHVFSGEWNNAIVDGQHNWIRYYQIEKAGQIVYQGHYHYDGNLTGTFKYSWEKQVKEIGGFLIGTSPAFDFSLFTMCALTHPGEGSCQYEIDGFPLKATSYTETCADGGLCLTTSYPEDIFP